MAKPQNVIPVPESLDPDLDRHETFTSALRRILQEAEIGDEPVERLEVYIHATGEVTYRYWAPRAEESDGGYLAPNPSH